MRFYYPEKTNQIDFVGYNNAIRLILKAMPDLFTDNPAEADFRFYANIPCFLSTKELVKSKLPVFYYTMYETTRLPKHWVRMLNKNVAVVGVPSEFCKNVFIASGVKRPVVVMALGLSSGEVVESIKTSQGGKYVFMWQGVALDGVGSHKGCDIAIKAFKELRQDGLLENATLILKSRVFDSVEIKDYSFESGIRLMQTEMSRSELNEVYKDVDCCINPTRGEGFGLIPLEQMAMGKPVIVTGFSIPYLNEDVCFPLKYTLVESPMWWNHRHLRISKSAISYNVSGIQKIKRLLPKHGAQLIPFRIGKTRISARVNNAFLKFQDDAKFFFNKTDKSICLYQENPGKDACVDVQDLKTKMLWCYNNRNRAEAMGVRAREYVLKKWTLEKMKSDFNNNLLPLLQELKK